MPKRCENMVILVLTIELYASWVHSLKEKRMEVKSLVSRLQNKFNVSAAEVAQQDMHQTIVIGIAAIAANTAQVDSISENILQFVENATDAELMHVQRELR